MKPLALLVPAVGLTLLGFPKAGVAQRPDSVLAVVGATVIDGTGKPPLTDGVVMVTGNRITAVGRKSEVTVPKSAKVIDATGKFLLPGFIDTNVHLSLYWGLESLARYEDRFTDIAIEGAQLQLKYGVTSVRDSYGMLRPLKEARDRIDRGEVPGSRILFAGNIVGWGGPWSYTFSGTRQENLSLFQEQMNDAIAAHGGEELMNMTPEGLRVAINRYLDQGVDFVKYGGTSHAFFPAMLGFSEAAQKVIVEETHKRGKVAETHSTSPEGLRLAIEAGVDLIQHPEATDALIPSDLIRLMVSKRVICSILENTITGIAWTDFQKGIKAKTDSVARADSVRKADSVKVVAGDTLRSWADSTIAELLIRRPTRVKTQGEVDRDSTNQRMIFRRRNAEGLIKAGCITTASTDNYRGSAPEFERTPRTPVQQPGVGTIFAIEGLVELGMTPAQAIVAATRNGALAMRMADRLGTIEVGKMADLVLLRGDPLADIHNIRKLIMVVKDGKIVELGKLPEKPVFYRPVAKPAG
jgi:imidazolonepropionase-like amidohydrolase